MNTFSPDMPKAKREPEYAGSIKLPELPSQLQGRRELAQEGAPGVIDFKKKFARTEFDAALPADVPNRDEVLDRFVTYAVSGPDGIAFMKARTKDQLSSVLEKIKQEHGFDSASESEGEITMDPEDAAAQAEADRQMQAEMEAQAEAEMARVLKEEMEKRGHKLAEARTGAEAFFADQPEIADEPIVTEAEGRPQSYQAETVELGSPDDVMEMPEAPEEEPIVLEAEEAPEDAESGMMEAEQEEIQEEEAEEQPQQGPARIGMSSGLAGIQMGEQGNISEADRNRGIKKIEEGPEAMAKKQKSSESTGTKVENPVDVTLTNRETKRTSEFEKEIQLIEGMIQEIREESGGDQETLQEGLDQLLLDMEYEVMDREARIEELKGLGQETTATENEREAFLAQIERLEQEGARLSDEQQQELKKAKKGIGLPETSTVEAPTTSQKSDTASEQAA